ncbi:GTPase Era [Compostibacter hankyongensis]|uniref:GTPase Era n=1 Tax=Compostibacter hankyongensis TaxID=1007089 RepID=A0ABP8G222_9BACT
MHKAGFVHLFGLPNAGKSTLLNALVGEKLAIVSPKVQTTRHRILGILTTPDYQLVFSDTPGVVEPRYRLHEKMMATVKGAMEDADVVVLLLDAAFEPAPQRELLDRVPRDIPVVLAVNKTDRAGEEKLKEIGELFKDTAVSETVAISALKQQNLDRLLEAILRHIPESPAYYPEDTLTDRPMRFFVAELIREKIYQLYREELPYHTAVVVGQFEEKNTLTKITADIVVQRETQKGIILGEKGKMLRELGTRARQDIEQFIGRKVFLELHVKVRGKWRDNEIFLKEYGY